MKIKTKSRSTVLASAFLMLFLICISSTALASTIPASNSASSDTVESYTFVTKWGSSGSEDGYFADPIGIAVDSSGDVYVADTYNNRIQKFDSNGNFITKWGSSGSEDGQFNYPYGIAVDSSSNVYVADTYNNRIQKFDSNGMFITKWGSYGSEDGQFNSPVGIAVDSSYNVYATDFENHRIQKFDSNGMFITKWGSYGSEDGQFNYPIGVTVDSSSNVYVADYWNNRIQKFDSNGMFITKWGSYGSEDGQFNCPVGIAVDSSDNVYATDFENHRIQKFDSNGIFITKWGSYGSEDGQFSYPTGIAVDSSSNVYVADYGNNRIQKFAPIETHNPAPIYNPENGHYYDVISVAGINWEDANNAAQSLSYSGMNGHLVTITSQDENDFIVNNIDGDNCWWLGGYQPDDTPDSMEPDGNWQWVTEEKWDYTNWPMDRPDNAWSGQDCLALWSGKNWDDASSIDDMGYISGYIVEYEEISEPLPIYNPENDHYYEVKNVPGSITWEDANNAAQSSSYSGMKGYLATITSQNENEFIVNNFNMHLNYNWLGGFQPDGSAEPDGGWQWVTGEPWDYTNWNSGEPSNGGIDGEDRLHIYANGFWNDDSDDSTIQNGYIVEYEGITPKPPAPAREITVGNNSEADFISIQEAVNNSVPGNTIIVMPGIYTENILVNVPGLTIRSELNYGSVQVKPLDESKSTFMITTDNITISGLNIVGPSQDYEKSAIFIYGDMNNLTGNTIENGCILLGPERRGNLIAENKISNGEGKGIHISCCGFDTNIVSNNTISNCSTGIYEYDQAADIRNNRITDCSYGIELAQASSVIDNNTILNCDVGILLGESCYAGIINNKIMFCEECGIFDQDKFGDRIYNNYLNNSLNVKFGDDVGEGDTWNTSLTQGTNIAGGPYIGGNFWAKPDGTGFSQTCVDLDENGIGDLPYNIYGNEFDYLPLVSLSSPQNSVIPIANFTASITNGNAPLLVQFTDFSENAIERNWNFGDGTNSTEQNPTHTYYEAGNYTVNLTASNIGGIDSKLSTITVFGPVNPAEQNFSSNATNVYAPVNVQIGNLSQNATTINWNIGLQQLGNIFGCNGQNVSDPVTVQIGNLSQNATTINWNISA